MSDSYAINELARQNRLLAGLSEEELGTVAPNLTLVDLSAGQVLHEADEAVTSAYFPLTAVVSLVVIMENGDTTDVALVGNEGVSAVSGYLGEGLQPMRVVVQSEGTALRMPMSDIRERFTDCGAFQQILLRYVQYLLAQTSQTAACNRLHSVEQQLCRWLLISDDLRGGGELKMTHDAVADILGCSRVSVSVSASKLQQRGWIAYKRGVIKITDRKGLESAVCECYKATLRHYEGIFEREDQ